RPTTDACVWNGSVSSTEALTLGCVRILTRYGATTVIPVGAVGVVGVPPGRGVGMGVPAPGVGVAAGGIGAPLTGRPFTSLRITASQRATQPSLFWYLTRIHELLALRPVACASAPNGMRPTTVALVLGSERMLRL